MNLESEKDIIMPTWNSMPEFEVCLKTLKGAFLKDQIHELIIVDKESTDGTLETAEKYNEFFPVKILEDKKTLGSARLTGLRHARTDEISFIDSDIGLDKGWMKQIIDLVNDGIVCDLEDIGWIFGRTIDDWSPLKEEKLWKLELELTPKGRIVTHRAYTNNTICLRKPLLNSKIEHLNAWEDYILTQDTIKSGFKVVELPVTCNHLHSFTFDKIENYSEAWGISGELKAKGFNFRTLMRPFWNLYWGARCTWHFKNWDHLKFNSYVFKIQIKALLNTSKYFVWERKPAEEKGDKNVKV